MVDCCGEHSTVVVVFPDCFVREVSGESSANSRVKDISLRGSKPVVGAIHNLCCSAAQVLEANFAMIRDEVMSLMKSRHVFQSADGVQKLLEHGLVCMHYC